MQGRETIWVGLVVYSVCFLGLGLYWSMISSGMTLRDRLEMFLTSLLLGILPLAIGLCCWGALRLTRAYIDHARATEESGRLR